MKPSSAICLLGSWNWSRTPISGGTVKWKQQVRIRQHVHTRKFLSASALKATWLLLTIGPMLTWR
uniref:Secreted protein n=1 Tax=Macrostomum lignano TaxID=282301 RepID=A0A1I8F9G8_9PLAT